jgi:hypothetical protein
MKTSTIFKRKEPTSVQISRLRRNGLVAKAIQDKDIYACITLDKILESAGVTELEDCELARFVQLGEISKREGIDIAK